jgi:hypothetical protein
VNNTDKVDRIHSMLRWILEKTCLASLIVQHVNLAKSKPQLHTNEHNQKLTIVIASQITGLPFSISKREMERISVYTSLLTVVLMEPPVVE